MRNYRELSEAEIAELERLYPVTPTRALSARFDVSVDGLIDHIAKPRGWKKDLKAVMIGNRGGKSLTEKQVQWIIKHFKHTKNRDIMAKFGIGESQVHRIARQYGLKKSKQHMGKCQRNASEQSRIVCREHGLYDELSKRMKVKMREYYESGQRIPGSFLPGQSNRDRLSPKRFEECCRKIKETMGELRRKERLRIHWGLPQKTKLKLSYNGYTPEARRRSIHRHLFRKFDYIVEKGSNIIYYDELTERRPQMEANASRYGLRVQPLEENYEHQL